MSALLVTRTLGRKIILSGSYQLIYCLRQKHRSAQIDSLVFHVSRRHKSMVYTCRYTIRSTLCAYTADTRLHKFCRFLQRTAKPQEKRCGPATATDLTPSPLGLDSITGELLRIGLGYTAWQQQRATVNVRKDRELAQYLLIPLPL